MKKYILGVFLFCLFGSVYGTASDLQSIAKESSSIAGEYKRYNNGEAQNEGAKTLIPVTFSLAGKHQIILEITREKNGLVISNILYPDDKTDLLKLLSLTHNPMMHNQNYSSKKRGFQKLQISLGKILKFSLI